MFYFVHDLQNYPRYSPVYLSVMYTSDPITWEFLVNENFSVNKTKIPFSALGADHALEQENRGMKVLAELKELEKTKQHNNCHFLIASEMNTIDSFHEIFHLSFVFLLFVPYLGKRKQ